MLAHISTPELPATTVLWILLCVALFVVALLAWSSICAFTGGHFTAGPYKSKAILTKNEIEFYNRLVSALPGYVVLSQVAMSALIEPRTSDPSEYMRRRTKFAQKFIDFVICEPGNLNVIALVELDDVTHNEEKDAQRDAMTNSAGYTTIRWHSRRKPDREMIAKTIRQLERD